MTDWREHAAESLADLARAIGDAIVAGADPAEVPEPSGVVTRFVVVAEVLDADGSRWLCQRSARADGSTVDDWEADAMVFAFHRNPSGVEADHDG